MKILFLMSLFLFTLTAVEAACSKKIDNTKVMMFIDTNESALEISTAEKAACDRGQKLVVIPKNYKELDKSVKPLNEAQSQFTKCITNSLGDSAKCSEVSSKLAKLREEHGKFMSKQPPIQEQIASELNGIRDNKGTLENFTISGHDGGGTYGGAKQSISRDKIQEILKDYKDINNVRSVMLLGCYTGVPKEIQSWKTIFPEVRLIGGYDGSAPLAFRPEGHDYLYNLLTKEKEMTSVADEKKIQSLIDKNLKSIKLLNASMFLYPTCKNNVDDKSFYYSTSGKVKGVQEYKMGECEKHASELADITDRISKYNTGELEPPTNTATGELRSIYSQTRIYEHCLSGYSGLGGSMNGSLAFGLLFFGGMKDNFTNYYKDDLKKADEILKGMTQEDFDKSHKVAIDNINSILGNIEKGEEMLKLLETDPEKYFELKEKEQKVLEENYNNKLNLPEYKSFIQRFPSFKLDSDQAPSSYPTTPEDMKLYMELGPAKGEIWSAKNDLRSVKQNPQRKIIEQRTFLAQIKTYQENSKAELVKNKLTVDVLKDVWIPTKENLKGKTRKEILENLHKMNGVLSKSNLPEKIRGTLGWSTSVTSNHLQYLMNPFSWHEVTGDRTEAPPYTLKLDEVLKQTSSSSGMSNGYSYGFMPMGGGGMGGYPGMGRYPTNAEAYGPGL